MSTYNIFIDESGNFDDLNNLSLVAGYISTKSAKEVDSIVFNLFSELASKYQVKDKLIHHLTQLKRKNMDEAFNIIKDVFESTKQYNFSYFVMKNQLDVKIEDPDDTYLNMLCDAIANIILNIHSEDRFAEFIIYPAIKKRNSIVERHLSFSEERKLDFDDIFIKEYSGLVMEKLNNLFIQIGKDLPKVKINLKNARHFAPLFLSDYLCNTIYNRDKEPSKTLYESYILPYLKFNFMFSLTTIRNQIDTSLYNGNLANAIFMLLKAYEGVEEIGDTEEERILILNSLKSIEKNLINFLKNKEYEERFYFAITYILKNIEFQSKKDKNHRTALLWYRKLINFVSGTSYKTKDKLIFLIMVDKLSLLNRSGYLINSKQLIEKIEIMIPIILNSTEIIQKVLHFYNVAAVSKFNMYQFKEANIYIEKSLKYLKNLSLKMPEFLEGFEFNNIQIPEYGKSLGTAGRIKSVCHYFKISENENYEELFKTALMHLPTSESKLRCYCYMVFNEIINKNGKKAFIYLDEISKLVDFDPNSDFVESYFKRQKPLAVLMLLKFLNTNFSDDEIYQKQQKIAEKVINKTEYFSNFYTFFYPISSLLREWILFRFNYFSFDDSVTFYALYQFLRQEKYHVFPQLILLKLSMFAVEIIVSKDSERIYEISKEILTDLNILIENDKEHSLHLYFKEIKKQFKDIHKNSEISLIKKRAIELRELIFI